MDTYRKQIEEMEEKEKAAKEVLAKHDLRAETFKIISFVEFIKSLAPKSIYDQKASSKGIISV